MRVTYSNIDQPKHMAKLLARETSKPLMACQQALAAASGYRDWYELEAATNKFSPAFSASGLSVEDKVTFILTITNKLAAQVFDVQYAVSQMNVFQWANGVREQLDIRSKLLRQTTIPDLGRRKPGSVGKLRGSSRHLILRSFGRPVSAISNKSTDCGVADFEFVTPRQSLPLFVPDRLYFAYGAWTDSSGSVVLHSRDYLPLWRIGEGKRPKRVDPTTRIEHVDALDQWFWDDTSNPWDSPNRRAEEITRLESYGITGLPYLADILEDVVHSKEPLTPHQAAQLRFRKK